MNAVNFIFLIPGIFFSVLIIALLFRYGRNNFAANSMLCLSFSAVIWYAFMILMFSSGEIRYYPELYNKGNPFYYVFAPASYLYVRLLLSPQRKLKKTDWLHFIPSFLALIDILPYMFKTAAEKQHIVDLIATDPSWNYKLVYAFIPQKVHYLIRGCQLLIYLFFQWKVFFSYTQTNKIEVKTKYWLYCFNSVVTLLVIIISIMTVQAVVMHADDVLSNGMFPVSISIGIFVLSIGLFFWPHLLYEVKLRQLRSEDLLPPGSEKEDADLSREEKARQVILTEDMITEMTRLLEKTLQEQELYRERGLTISKLAGKLKLPQRNLSWLLNSHYKLRFNDFINIYRIEYVKRKIAEGAMHNRTLEALADDAGFSSRTTFYSAFKKSTGLSPTEYIAKKHAD